MVEAMARILLGGGKDRGGSVWVFSVQMRGNREYGAVAGFKRGGKSCWHAWLDELGGEWLQWAVAAGDEAER